MTKNFLWHINKDQVPQRLNADSSFRERNLEDWIERDPGLLQAGLLIVGRQIRVASGRLDLLALDPSGRFVVLEIKRLSLYRESIAQGLDYVACVGAMSAIELETACNEYLQRKNSVSTLRELLTSASREDQLDSMNREVLLYVVGTASDKSGGVERISELLSPCVAVSSFAFQIYAIADGQRVLLRERVDSDDGITPKCVASAAPTLKSLMEQADESAVGRDFRNICETSNALELYARCYKFSVMFAPMSSKNRALFTVWTKPVNNKLKVYVSAEAIAEFFPISTADAAKIIGFDGIRELNHEAVNKLLPQLKQIFGAAQEESSDSLH